MPVSALDPSLSDQIDDLLALVERSRVIAGFTGAGISTESGVPDFRSPGSPWLKNQPIPFEAYIRSAEARLAPPFGLQGPSLLDERAHEEILAAQPNRVEVVDHRAVGLPQGRLGVRHTFGCAVRPDQRPRPT